MDRLLKVTDVMEIVGCERDKARAIMRTMRHMDLSNGGLRANLRVWEKDLQNWLNTQMQNPWPERKRGRKPKAASSGTKLIPYRKAE